MKKFELTTNTKMFLGKKLFQIKALINFGDVEAGELGGYIEKEENLSQAGDAWVTGDARVAGDARVTGDAWVAGDAWVTDNAWVAGDAWVADNACYTTIKGFGREYRTTTFFRCKDGKVRVQCGCFYGDLEEFRAIVKETHGKSKKAIEYLIIADLMELHFEEKENDK